MKKLILIITLLFVSFSTSAQVFSCIAKTVDTGKGKNTNILGSNVFGIIMPTEESFGKLLYYSNGEEQENMTHNLSKKFQIIDGMLICEATDIKGNSLRIGIDIPLQKEIRIAFFYPDSGETAFWSCEFSEFLE